VGVPIEKEGKVVTPRGSKKSLLTVKKSRGKEKKGSLRPTGERGGITVPGDCIQTATDVHKAEELR